MNLSFESAAALFALPLAAVPWLLHRWSLSRAKPLPFPSLELLKAALRSSFGSSFLSRRLLLLLRTLLALALVLFLSRPVLRGGAGRGRQGPAVTLLAIDVSASMDARTAGRSALAWAAEEAAGFLPAPGSADRAGLVAFSDRVERTVPISSDPARMKEALGALECSFRPTRTDTALSAAQALLAGERGEKTIVLFTDAARNGWGFPAVAGLDPSARLVIVRPPSPGANGGIASVRTAAFSGGAGRLEAAAWGDPRPASRGWTFSWEGKRAAQGVVASRPVAQGTALPFSPAKPLARGEADLDPDALPWDDAFYVLPPAGADVALLAVNGSPALAPASDETYFLSSVFEALRREGFRVKTVLPAALETESLEEWNVLMLLNTGKLPPRTEERVTAFVEKGGGLWMTAGDGFAPGGLTALLPARPTGRLVEGEGIVFPAEAARDPLGKRLAEEGGFDWSGLRADKAIEAAPAGGARVLLAGARSGNPVLAVGRFGRGRTALLSTTIDRDWTNLPAHPLFPVMCREAWTFLSGREEATAAALTVDQAWEGPLPAGGADVLVERPDGVLEAPSLRNGRFRYERTDRPGFYTLRSRRGPSPLARAAVNADRSAGEGDLAPVDPAQVKERVPCKEVDWISVPDHARGRFDELVRGRPLANALAALIFALIGFETLLLGLMKR